MITYTISNTSNIQITENIDKINIFCQYFIHPNKERHEEIVKCLKMNVNNEYITQIYLLNERIYTEEELDISSNKIIQINIGHRLQFKDVFEYINSNNITGYNVIINSDIFFTSDIKNLFKTDIHINKKMYALLRYEYDEIDIEKSQLFGHRGDSQDTWIIHSNFNIGTKENKMFNFEFGKPGCDNKLIYLMFLLGYEVLNDPEFIKSYHIHKSNIRNYNVTQTISPPYEIIMPKNSLQFSKQYSPAEISIIFNTKYHHRDSNDKLFNYITNKINKNETFIIPRLSNIETNYAIFTMTLLLPEYASKKRAILNFLENSRKTMKNNAGIKISSTASSNKYSKLYLESLKNCELFGALAPHDNMFRTISEAHTIINNLFKTKETYYSEALDIFHYIYTRPWTWALKGKRLLMISNFEESIKSKINSRKEIYGVDLFPNCEIITIRPPQTQGSEDSEEFDIELNKFTQKLDAIKDKYDIALVSCGGYGSLVCNHIYKSKKSAIYVGGVLQMYWGILGSRWLKDRPDIIRLFLNSSWSRPINSEKPKGFENIEGSCYW